MNSQSKWRNYWPYTLYLDQVTSFVFISSNSHHEC